MTHSNKPTPPKKPSTGTREAKQDDVVILHSKTADGEGAVVLRKKGEQLSIGEIRPLVTGQPVTGEVVQLTPRGDGSPLCDVETVVEGPAVRDSVGAPSKADFHAGPSRVSSSQYRNGWDTLWGRRGRRGRTTAAGSKKLN